MCQDRTGHRQPAACTRLTGLVNVGKSAIRPGRAFESARRTGNCRHLIITRAAKDTRHGV